MLSTDEVDTLSQFEQTFCDQMCVCLTYIFACRNNKFYFFKSTWLQIIFKIVYGLYFQKIRRQNATGV